MASGRRARRRGGTRLGWTDGQSRTSHSFLDVVVSFAFRVYKLISQYDEDILDVLATFAPPQSHPPASHSASRLPTFDPQSVSEALCAKAREISEQTGATTPFMERAIEEGIDFVGGKKDGQFFVSLYIPPPHLFADPPDFV